MQVSGRIRKSYKRFIIIAEITFPLTKMKYLGGDNFKENECTFFSGYQVLEAQDPERHLGFSIELIIIGIDLDKN